MLSEADKQLADARDAYFDELPTALWRQLFGGLTTAQRGDLIVALVQLAGALLLSYSLVANLCLACTATISWGIAASRAAASPLASAAGWSSFLTTHSTICLDGCSVVAPKGLCGDGGRPAIPGSASCSEHYPFGSPSYSEHSRLRWRGFWSTSVLWPSSRLAVC